MARGERLSSTTARVAVGLAVEELRLLRRRQRRPGVAEPARLVAGLATAEEPEGDPASEIAHPWSDVHDAQLTRLEPLGTVDAQRSRAEGTPEAGLYPMCTERKRGSK